MRSTLLMLFIFLSGTLSHAAERIPWVSIFLKNEQRPILMRLFDSAMDRQFVDLFNQEVETSLHLEYQEGTMDALLQSHAPIAVLHYDILLQPQFTEAEKQAMLQFFERGGFLLIFENGYGYDSPELRKNVPRPASSFFLQELPQRNPLFRAERPGVEHGIYHQMYNVVLPKDILKERTDNRYSPDGYLITYRNQPAAFFVRFHGWWDEENSVFIGVPPPYGEPNWIPEGYQMLLNLFVYATSH